MLLQTWRSSCYQVVSDVGTSESTIDSVRFDLEYLKYIKNKFLFFLYNLSSDRMGSKSTPENKNLTKYDDMCDAPIVPHRM